MTPDGHCPVVRPGPKDENYLALRENISLPEIKGIEFLPQTLIF